MKQRSLYLFFISLFYSGVVFGQLPDTDLCLFKLDRKAMITASCNITNRPGYDNQPSFSANGKSIYYTSIKEDKQADIYNYQIKSKRTKQLTHTIESEYSPVESPISNCLSVVTVLKDSSQVIQLLSPKEFTVVNSSVSGFDSVGYYHFINEDTVLYYKLTDPHSLRYYVISSKEDGLICEYPTRTFKTIDRSHFIYGIKDSVSTSYFIYDVQLQKSHLLARSQSVNEDMIWHRKLGLLISDSSRILHYNADSRSWEVLYDLSSYGIKKITRFCFDPEGRYLVVVNNL